MFLLEQINENIKLVIWDLDETFWTGTLGEEGIELQSEHVKLVNILNYRGIMNSICSKNNYTTVKEFLESHALWDLFVYPIIAWKPKGQLINEIIKKFKILPQNVVFIDDNINNLHEVKFYIPTIHCLLPNQISLIVTHPCFQGKEDLGLVRLQQYRALEQRSLFEQNISSNEDFLYESEIKVEIITNCLPYVDRIIELIIRTNQLNYTKKRDSKDELIRLLNTPAISAGCVKVTDRFGDYGIVGFYVVRGQVIEHLLFSCRVLNMGVEQWVYSSLDYPKLKIVGEVASQLDDSSPPSWINQEQKSMSRNSNHSNGKINCIIRGGCDLEQIYHYLAYYNITIENELGCISSITGEYIRRDHTEIIKQMFTLSDHEKKQLIDLVPFYDNNIFDSQMFNAKNNVVVYSPLMDFYAGMYVVKNIPNIKVPYKDYNLPITDKRTWDLHKQHSAWINPEFLQWAYENLEYKGPISEKEFEENLFLFRQNLPETTVLIIMNGSEVDISHPFETYRNKRHIQMNRILNEFVSHVKYTYLIDVRRYISSSKDHALSITHYKRHIYKQISDEIIKQIANAMQLMLEIDQRKKRQIEIRDILQPEIHFG